MSNRWLKPKLDSLYPCSANIPQAEMVPSKLFQTSMALKHYPCAKCAEI